MRIINIEMWCKHMNLKQIFGKNVKFYRYQKNLRQEKFAELIELNTAHVSDIENGKVGPTFDNITKISKVLDIDTYLLFQENEYTHTNLPKRVDMYTPIDIIKK